MTVTTHPTGADMNDVTTCDLALPGDVSARVIRIVDDDGTETAAQIDAPDRPLTPVELCDLADALRALAASMGEGSEA